MGLVAIDKSCENVLPHTRNWKRRAPYMSGTNKLEILIDIKEGNRKKFK